MGLDTASQKLLVSLMRQQLKRDGIIIATTHVSLGLEPDQSLQLKGQTL